MKIVIINKSDSTGGAAVVSRRLMEALREEGVDARMLVAEKLSDSPYIHTIASPLRLKWAFLADRLRIAFANGFRRSTLFKLDAAAAGIDPMRNPLVKEADAIFINWINQGVLSLRGLKQLLRSGKKIIWTMHDQWNFTGLCHHTDGCEGFSIYEPGGGRCGFCPMLGRHGGKNDLSRRINDAKSDLYAAGNIRFVAVSNWLAERARESRLLRNADIYVIPNPFPMPEQALSQGENSRFDKKEGVSEGWQEGKATEPTLNLIFGAARLDDEVKDFPMLIEVLRQLKLLSPQLSARTRLILFGAIKDATLLAKIPIEYDYKGTLTDRSEINALYAGADIVLSTSKWETLPGTLIEGQAQGAWPIAFDAGGQRDIIDDGLTGSLIPPADPAAMAAAISAFAHRHLRSEAPTTGSDSSPSVSPSPSRSELRELLRSSVAEKFSARAVARAYLALLISSPS